MSCFLLFSPCRPAQEPTNQTTRGSHARSLNVSLPPLGEWVSGDGWWVSETYDGLEVLLLVLVVVVAEVHQLPPQVVLELPEGLDGLLPRGVGRVEVAGLGGGLLLLFVF